MSRVILILLGGPSSGKSKTIDAFFDNTAKSVTHQELKTEMGDVNVWKLCSSSPQESSGFGEYGDVESRIFKRIRKIIDADYVAILPFTIPFNDKTGRAYTANLIIKPIKNLKKQGYHVLVVYLRKHDIYDSTVKKLWLAHTIESKKGKYQEQSVELKDFIKKAYQP